MGRALLLLVSGLFIAYGVVFKSVNERQKLVGLPERSGDYLLNEQGRNVTSSLVDLALESIEKNQNRKTPWDYEWGGSFMYTNFLGADTATLRGFDENMTTSEHYPENTNIANAGGWNKYRVLLYGTSVFNGRTTYTEVLMQQDSFSKYSYFTHIESDNIWFMSKDTLTGPVHTNGIFHIAGSPVFNGFVTSPNDWEGHTSYTNEPEFNGGSNFSTTTKQLPDPNGSQTAQLKNLAQSRGLFFDNPIEVRMQGDTSPEKITVFEKVDSYTTVEHTVSKAEYNEGAIASSQKVEIQGTLKGRLTVYSESDVEILGDLKYNTHPVTDSTSTDLLGIVSANNILVDRDAHTTEGTGDLTLHASMMAINGSFSVEDYASGSPRGQIHLLGGLLQYERGPVGTFSSGGIQSGYSKNYVYDTRLLSTIPPSFPRESPFSIVYWRDRSDFFDIN